MWLVPASIFCAAALLGYEYYEHEAVQITERSVLANGLIADRALRLCVISDLHNNKKRCEEKLLAKLRAYKPDAFLLCGDMVNKHKKDNAAALHFIKELTEIAPAIYSYGNHESELAAKSQKAWRQYVRKLPQKCVLLDNQTIDAGEWLNSISAKGSSESGSTPDRLGAVRNLFISGLTLPPCFYGKGALRISEGAGSLPELAVPYRLARKPYHILLAHHPEYDVLYKKYMPDLILSGHLHGGLVRLPLVGGLISPRYRFPKKDSGFYKNSFGTLFVSRGLGSHTIPLRVFNRTELTIMTLVPGGDGRKKKR